MAGALGSTAFTHCCAASASPARSVSRLRATGARFCGVLGTLPLRERKGARQPCRERQAAPSEVRGCRWRVRANALPVEEPSWACDVDRVAPLGFSFSPGALLLPYYLGVAEELIERGFITDATPLAGSSAGFIAVTCIASGVPFPIIVGYFKDFMRDLRANGTVSRVQPVMRRVMNEMLPEDIHIRLNARAGDSGCGITQLNIGEPQSALTPLVIREFFSKADVISAVEASGWTPFWIGPGMFVEFRDYGPCIDGFATNFLPQPLNCKQVVNVTASHGSALAALGLVEKGGVDICPDAESRFNFLQLSAYALIPYEDETLDELVEMGRTDAARWAVQNPL